MTLGQILTEFQKTTAPEATRAAMQAEEDRLAAFEKGYQAGWEDCLRAQSEDQRRLLDQVKDAVLDTGFTFEEARSHFETALVPLLSAIAQSLLPSELPKRIIIDAMSEVAREAVAATDTPLRAECTAALRPLLESALSEMQNAPPIVIADHLPDDPDQPSLRICGARHETVADPEALVKSVARLFDGFRDAVQRKDQDVKIAK